ncbi:hypothetical protein MKZ38_000526 [Zalerion maritima]|uniref:Uncharacterized protein n=1 Tax=Zalerion maritima TaxID=339359 RepID=A0AAD5RSG7_9PEZI|nr:hypothetical protein MKZ38_000526 [Zalerion maritima]
MGVTISTLHNLYTTSKTALSTLFELKTSLATVLRRASSPPSPVPNSTTPYWTTSPPHPEISYMQWPEGLPEETDIVVVGSGIAGLSIACHEGAIKILEFQQRHLPTLLDLCGPEVPGLRGKLTGVLGHMTAQEPGKGFSEFHIPGVAPVNKPKGKEEGTATEPNAQSQIAEAYLNSDGHTSYSIVYPAGFDYCTQLLLHRRESAVSSC